MQKKDSYKFQDIKSVNDMITNQEPKEEQKEEILIENNNKNNPKVFEQKNESNIENKDLLEDNQNYNIKENEDISANQNMDEDYPMSNQNNQNEDQYISDSQNQYEDHKNSKDQIIENEDGNSNEMRNSQIPKEGRLTYELPENDDNINYMYDSNFSNDKKLNYDYNSQKPFNSTNIYTKPMNIQSKMNVYPQNNAFIDKTKCILYTDEDDTKRPICDYTNRVTRNRKKNVKPSLNYDYKLPKKDYALNNYIYQPKSYSSNNYSFSQRMNSYGNNYNNYYPNNNTNKILSENNSYTYRNSDYSPYCCCCHDCHCYHCPLDCWRCRLNYGL